MTLYNDVCTCMLAHCVKVLASYIASLATIAKKRQGMFNSAQCIHELVSILIHLCGFIKGFKTFLWLKTAGF